MPIIEVTTTATELIRHNKRRKFVSFTNIDDSHYVFISDEGKPAQTNPKWALSPGVTLIIDRTIGFPERAFYAISDGQAKCVIGFQNEGELQK